MKINKRDFRTDLNDYFKLSGIREFRKLSHNPFIVLNNGVIELCRNAGELIDNYPPETEVIAQWKGQWSSDFFYFKVEDLIEYIKKNPKEDYYVV